MFVKELFNSVSVSWLSSLRRTGRYTVTWHSVCIPRLPQMQ